MNEKENTIITITESARAQIIKIIKEQDEPNLMLRVFVEGGGCSGFNYGFTLDTEKSLDDWDFEFDEYKMLVDPASMQYLQGATIDYVESIAGSNFSIQNPNAKATCGCGSSFTI